MEFTIKDGIKLVDKVISTIQENRDYLSQIDGEAGDGYVALGSTQFRIAGHSSGHGNSVQHSFLPLSFIFWISKSQALICL